MPPKKLGETIWGQLNDPDYDWLGPHQSEIEQMFAAAETKAKEEKGEGAGGDKSKKAAAKPGTHPRPLPSPLFYVVLSISSIPPLPYSPSP